LKLFYSILFLYLGLTLHAAILHQDIAVSSGLNNTISEPNTSRNVATDSSGNIYVVYHGENGIVVAKSSDRGASFSQRVQVSANDYEAEIAISPSNVIYVAWADGSSVYVSKSTDGGTSFSAPSNIGSTTASAVHMALYSNHLYIVTQTNDRFFYSHNSATTFSSQTVGTTCNYADVVVDPTNGDVFIITENPTIAYYTSSDSGVSFSAPVATTAMLNYSTATGIFNYTDKTFLIAGGLNTGYIGNEAFRIDTNGSTTTPLTFEINDYSRGRSLASTYHGYVIDGYTDSNRVYYALSSDNGNTFGTPVQVYNGTNTLSVAINRSNQDILVAYENGGSIYLNVYSDEIPAPPPLLPIGVPLFDSAARTLMTALMLFASLWFIRRRAAIA